jgi:hypothetical protein
MINDLKNRLNEEESNDKNTRVISQLIKRDINDIGFHNRLFSFEETKRNHNKEQIIQKSTFLNN